MAEKVLATKQIGFEGTVIGELNRPISVSINAEENPNGTRFFDNDIVNITVISEAPVTLTQSTFGNLFRSYDKVKQFEEFISFVEDDTASLGNAPKDGTFNFLWIGSRFNTGEIALNGKELKMSTKGTGMIKVIYDVDAVIYELQNGQDPTLCTFTNQDGNTASVVVNYLPQECDIPVNDVVIVVADSITGAPVGNAQVTVNGVFKGRTGGDGKISIGRLIRGERNTVDIIKTGYQRNGEDCLDNSEFTL